MSEKKKREMSAIGFSPEDFERNEPIAVWPNNRSAVLVFLAMRTQWHQGMAGPTGLNFASLPEVWRRLRIPSAERDEIFALLPVLESGALEAMYQSEDN